MAHEHDPEARRREEVLQRLVREARERQSRGGLASMIRFADERELRERSSHEHGA